MKQKSSFFKALGIMLLSVLFATQANAQNLTVTGTVTDNLGPVIGASIQVWKEQVTDVSQTLTETTPFPMFRKRNSRILLYRISDTKRLP